MTPPASSPLTPHQHLDRLWARAQRYVAARQDSAAAATLETLIRDAPKHTAAHLVLSGVYLQQGRMRAATLQAKAAADSASEDPDSVTAAAHACVQLGEMRAARDCLALFAKYEHRLSNSQWTSLAYAYERLGDNATALELLKRVAAQGCADPDFRYFYAAQLQFAGDLAAARAILENYLRDAPPRGRVLWSLAQLPRAPGARDYSSAIRAELAHAKAGSEDKAALEFALYRELERNRDYGAAFDALTAGNAIMHARCPVDDAQQDAIVDALVRQTQGPQKAAAGAHTDGPLPIFIVGLPRSGTTLLAQMLGNHPDVVSTGERNDFPRQLRWVADAAGTEALDPELLRRLPDLDYALLGQRYLDETQWRASGRRFYVDKLPSNYQLIGPIRRALPQAIILHMVRAPMDVCFSNYRALLGVGYAWSYALDALAEHYGRYRRVIAHWHNTLPSAVFTADYAKLVTDPEATLAEIFAHCGLRQIAGCSDLTRNASAVNTLSSPQIREPVHTRSIGAWRPYTAALAPLATALARNHGDEQHQ